MTEQIDRAEVVRRLREHGDAIATCKVLVRAIGYDCDDFTNCGECKTAWRNKIADLIEIAQDGPAWPLDADGVPCRFGDVLEWPGEGGRFEVVGIGDGNALFYLDEDGVQWTSSILKTHVKPRTLDDLLHDIDTWPGWLPDEREWTAKCVREAYELGRAATDDR